MSNNPSIVDGLVGQAYSSIRIANEIPGTLSKARNASGAEFKEILSNQVKLIQEELNETIKALEEENNVEILDGAADVFVTAAGLLQLLETRTHAREALLDVTANNLTKFISTFDPNCDKIIKDTIEMYEQKGIKVKASVNTAYNMVAFLDENGKYKKPSNYKKVDLESYVGGTNV